jgi:CRISPR-associated protein Csx10
MKAITYQLKLLEPVLVTSLSGDPNSAASFDYLPGSVLRGSFIGRYLQPPLVDLAADTTARRLFLSGETRWLNAYPVDRLGKRCLPTPLSIHEVKGSDEKTVYDLAIDPQEANDVQWKAVSKAFCRFADGDQVRLIEPERQISVHTARTRRYGRARSDKLDDKKGDVPGAVYRYDALAAGQVFEGVVWCDDTDAVEIKKLLSGKIRLGKSQNGGYGQAVIEKVSDSGKWNEYPLPDFLNASDANGDAALPSELIITFLSDVLLRDEKTGQFIVDTEAACQVLHTKLGGTLALKRAFTGQEILGGFNRKWGLPLPQAHAFAAGSVLVCQAENIDLKKLNDLLQEGIGERRAEGFGRFAVNWQIRPELKVEGSTASTLPSVKLDGEEAKLAERVAGHILRHRLDQRVTVSGLNKQVEKPPHKSQLARLRGVIQEELLKPQPDLQRVKAFIEELKLRNITRKQFSQARVSDKQLGEWLLEELGKTGDSAWAGVLNTDDKVKLQISLGGVTVKPTEQMKAEYLLRYLDAWLARVAKQIGKERE